MLQRLPALALLSALALAAAGTALAAAKSPPEISTEGSYQGTWMYRDRVSRLAIWIEERRGRVRNLRYRYFYNDGSYGYTTDEGSGPSRSGMMPGEITLSWEHDRKSDVISGSIERRWGGPGVEARASSEFEMHRIEGGRKIFCRFTNGTHELTEDGTSTRSQVPDLNMTFNLVTDELVHWEELLY